MNREIWKSLYRTMRANGSREVALCLGEPKSTYARRRAAVAGVCDTNADIRATLDDATVGGAIGIITSGMDCDCTSYHRERVRRAFSSVAECKLWDADRCEGLDGIESVYFVTPDKVDRRRNASRDLALEAFEDGHPGTVYYSGALS